MAWWLARLAADHGLMGDIVTRVAFFIINCLLVLIFENKIHYFQYRHIWMVNVNGLLVLLSTQMNPIFTYALMYVLTYPSFKRSAEEISEFIDEAINDDEKMWFLTNPHKPTRPTNPDRNYFMVGQKVVKEYHSSSEGEEAEQEEVPKELPKDGPKEFDIEEELLKGTDLPVIDFTLSITIMLALIEKREVITPDVLHFISSMVDDEVHFICIMIYWLTWKCFLLQDENKITKFNKHQIVEERVKIVVRGLLELTVALTLSQPNFENFWPWIYCYGMYILMALRSIFSE